MRNNLVHNTDDMSFEAGEGGWATGSENCLKGPTKNYSGICSTSRPYIMKATIRNGSREWYPHGTMKGRFRDKDEVLGGVLAGDMTTYPHAVGINLIPCSFVDPKYF